MLLPDLLLVKTRGRSWLGMTPRSIVGDLRQFCTCAVNDP